MYAAHVAAAAGTTSTRQSAKPVRQRTWRNPILRNGPEIEGKAETCEGGPEPRYGATCGGGPTEQQKSEESEVRQNSSWTARKQSALPPRPDHDPLCRRASHPASSHGCRLHRCVDEPGFQAVHRFGPVRHPIGDLAVKLGRTSRTREIRSRRRQANPTFRGVRE